MRRPSPLPQPPSPGPRRGPDEASERGRRRDVPQEETTTDAAPGAVRADADERAAAPIIPLPSGRARSARTVRSSGDDDPAHPADSGEDGAAGEPSDEAGRVGLREVLTAARARRKALRAEVRRFTVRQRRRRALWLGAAASVLVLALATIAAAYSPLFAVERIVVEGTQQLSADEIADALSGQLGTPMPLVDESAIKAELVGFPLVETYALEARPPHDLVVRIVERTPIGLIETRAGYTLVDAAGVALSTTATPAAGTPVLSISGGVDSDAFTAAGQVMRSLPDAIRSQVTAVSASTPDDVTLTLGGTDTQVVWGSAERSAEKALVLESIMTTRPPEGVVAYDVSSPDAVVVR